ncbi:hypothetical protein B0T16DRAFT_413745 [Cercophora newfieldiana]|uniref:Uncharacterized protein n=1 Tax=Cercophora newfieldiana TaxID=92897 RepID=A0AA40CRK2_9PEZI|nr:hypothetical protein B0T16DRAFT_413745 [Cercophora newfieldiana]
MLPDGDPSYGFPKSNDTFSEDEDEMIGKQPPLFAHEALGMFDDVTYGENVVEDHHHEHHRAPEEIDQDDIDINDPTLERFPSNREEIIETVRKLQLTILAGLDEDQASFDGAPLSPVVGMSRRGTEDNVGDFVLSPIPVSPVVPRSGRRLDVTKSPRGSITSAHSSTASLQAIQEAEEPEPEEETRTPHVVRVSTPRGRSPLRNSFKSPGSDEDEGVVMKDTANSHPAKEENGRLLSPDDAESSAQGSDPANTALPENADEAPKTIASHTSGTSTPDGTPDKAQMSPRIVIGAPEGEAADGDAGRASTTAVDGGTDGNTARLRKTGNGQAEQAAARGSVPSAALPSQQEGGWFKAFFRLLFVDWIKGFISRLCGNRRNT